MEVEPPEVQIGPTRWPDEQASPTTFAWFRPGIVPSRGLIREPKLPRPQPLLRALRRIEA